MKQSKKIWCVYQKCTDVASAMVLNNDPILQDMVSPDELLVETGFTGDDKDEHQP